MLKSNSKDITFEQLMQQAAQVAKAQDSILIEKAKERKRQEEERQQKEQVILREKQKKERALLAKHQEIEARHRQLLEQKQHPVRKPPRPAAETKARAIPTSTKPKKKTTTVPAVPIFEKKKPVHMSYEQLMAKAKEVTTPKKPVTSSTPPPRKETKLPTSLDNRKDSQGKPMSSSMSSSLHSKRPTTTKSKRPSESIPPDRIRSNTPVRPKRPPTEERDIRPMGEAHRYRSDTRPRPPPPPPSSSSQPPLPRKQPQSQRPPIRMPFRRAVDPKRQQRRPIRTYEDEEEDDEDLDSFIVEDDDDDGGGMGYERAHENDYSSEISKIFRYDRKRYANESVYSDDDMEANSMDVLREEKRSERLARREDQLEEQLELERQRKRQAKSRSK